MKKNSLLNPNAYRRLLAILSLVCFTGVVFGQSRQVTGKVVGNESDSAIVGATVSVKGSKIGTTTGPDGSFSISVPANATLVITYVGFTPQEIHVGNNSTFNVRLAPESQSIQQVVVIGYGTTKRKDLTGAVSSVTAEQIEKVPITTTEQALQGRAAGVQIINNDNSPGGNISVLIRGVGSLAPGGNAPLYVVDGYPTIGGINNINPNDIASIDVLKDASATAIYGIRAANGVVIITTKKGLKGKTQVTFDMYETVQGKPKEYNLLNAQQFATMSNQVEANDSTHSYHGLPIWHTPDQLHSVDWQNAMYHTGLIQSYNVGIRGGTDKAQSAISLGYYDQQGLVIESYFKRFTANLNLDYQPAKWLKSSTSIKYTYQDAKNPYAVAAGNMGSLYQMAVNPPTLDSGNRLTNQISDGKGNYGFFNPINPNVFKFSNPVYTVETNQYKNITNYVLASSSLEVTPFDGLRIKTNAGVNISDYSGSYYQPRDSRAFDQGYSAAQVTNALYHQSMHNMFEWLWENTIAYDKTFGQHAIHFVGGISAQKTTNNMMGAQGIPPNGTIRDLSQLSNLTFDQFNAALGQGNGQTIETMSSEFARLNYEYADKYIVTGTVRRDGSSKFAPGHQYGVFPSGAVAWKIKNESFMQDVSWVNDLKLRGSYGEVGNEIPIGLWQFQALYAGNYAANVNGGGSDNLGYPFDKVYQNGIAASQPENDNLRWETDIQTDIGLDAAFLNGALTFTADWFNRNSKNFLLLIATPAQTGFSYESENVGSMNNKGLEFTASYRPRTGKDFQWGVTATVSSYKNTLTSLISGTSYLWNYGGLTLQGQGWDQFSRSNVGGPVGEFWGYKSLGIFQSNAEVAALNAKAPGGIYYRAATGAGDRHFQDINGDGIVNPDSDRVALGNPQPKFFGGINFDGTYKNWDFNLYFYGTFGNKILNYTESNLESFQKRGSEGVENVSVNYYNNYWMPNRPSNKYSRALAVDDNTLNSVPSSAWVEDGSYLKLRSLTVGYSLPAPLLRNMGGISRVRLYFSTQNVFTITKYSGIDPEIGIQLSNPTQNGVDQGTYPHSRSYTFGLNVSF